MTTNDDLEDVLGRVASLYTDNLAQHGTSSKGVGWKDEASQALRFQKLCSAIPAHEEGPFTVNDLGCGYGAMYDHLNAAYGDKMAHYTGYDISKEMVDTARARLPAARTRIVCTPEPTETADYTFISGIFNVRFGTDERRWDDYIHETLRKVAATTRKAFAYNLLSTYVDWRSEDLHYADPARHFDHCKRNLSRYVTVLHDYPLYEWTLVVRMEP